MRFALRKQIRHDACASRRLPSRCPLFYSVLVVSKALMALPLVALLSTLVASTAREACEMSVLRVLLVLIRGIVAERSESAEVVEQPCGGYRGHTLVKQEGPVTGMHQERLLEIQRVNRRHQ
jgi:hypothetical protein